MIKKINKFIKESKEYNILTVNFTLVDKDDCTSIFIYHNSRNSFDVCKNRISYNIVRERAEISNLKNIIQL